MVANGAGFAIRRCGTRTAPPIGGAHPSTPSCGGLATPCTRSRCTGRIGPGAGGITLLGATRPSGLGNNSVVGLPCETSRGTPAHRRQKRPWQRRTANRRREVAASPQDWPARSDFRGVAAGAEGEPDFCVAHKKRRPCSSVSLPCSFSRTRRWSARARPARGPFGFRAASDPTRVAVGVSHAALTGGANPVVPDPSSVSMTGGFGDGRAATEETKEEQKREVPRARGGSAGGRFPADVHGGPSRRPRALLPVIVWPHGPQHDTAPPTPHNGDCGRRSGPDPVQIAQLPTKSAMHRGLGPRAQRRCRHRSGPGGCSSLASSLVGLPEDSLLRRSWPPSWSASRRHPPASASLVAGACLVGRSAARHLHMDLCGPHQFGLQKDGFGRFHRLLSAALATLPGVLASRMGLRDACEWVEHRPSGPASAAAFGAPSRLGRARPTAPPGLRHRTSGAPPPGTLAQWQALSPGPPLQVPRGRNTVDAFLAHLVVCVVARHGAAPGSDAAGAAVAGPQAPPRRRRSGGPAALRARFRLARHAERCTGGPSSWPACPPPPRWVCPGG